MSEKPQQTESEAPEIDMLNEILDRAMANVPDPPEDSLEKEAASGHAKQATGSVGKGEAKERDKGPSELEQASVSRETSEPEKHTLTPPGKNKRSSVYVYLAVMFAAAFLMLLLAYFVQQRNNETAMDNLRSTNTASRQELLDEIQRLEQENEDLQKEVTYQKSRVEQVKEEREEYKQSYDDACYLLSDQYLQKLALEYFWYLDQFMSNRDYPMAAALIVFSTDGYYNLWNSQISVNPAQVEQYEAYRQELIDRSYLDQPRDAGTGIWFADQWDPSQREDMAALGILWAALDAHFVQGNDEMASQYLCRYPLSNPNSGYQDRVERLASGFTLEQFQQLQDDLVQSQWLVIAEDGTMNGGPDSGISMDVLYGLPFELPESALVYIPVG